MECLKLLCYVFLFTVIDMLITSAIPVLGFKSKLVIALFKKSNVNDLHLSSAINEFERAQQLFAYIPQDELSFVEYDCQNEPKKCESLKVFGVPQIHAYVIKDEFTQKEKYQSEKKNNKIFGMFSTYDSIPLALQYFSHLSPIPIINYYVNFFKRYKYAILENTAENIAYCTIDLSNGKYQPDLEEYTLTPHRSVEDINKLVFNKYKCSVTTFYKYLIPTNVRDFYDDILLNQTFKQNFSLSDQIETSFVDGFRYEQEIKHVYNITFMPTMVIEYMGMTTITNTSISIEKMKQILLYTCNDSFIPKHYPKKTKNIPNRSKI